MSLSNNPPVATLELTAGEAEALQLFLTQKKAAAIQDFNVHQAMMMHSASDAELCDQMLAKLRGEPTAGRYQFKTAAEKIAALQAEQAAATGKEIDNG